MKKNRHRLSTYLAQYTALVLLSLGTLAAQTHTQEIQITNTSTYPQNDAPVVIDLKQLPVAFAIRSALVIDQNTEIPVQLDDLDQDNLPDELAFVLSLPPTSSRVVQVHLSAQPSSKTYPARVFAQMLLRGDNAKHQPIRSLTTPGTSDIYNLLHHHGPAFESELVAYRIYFDKKQTVDIYGKFRQRLEIEECQFYPTDEQLARGFGDDVLRVSGSMGLGTLKGWNGQKATHIEPIETRTETVLATGPVRTIVDVLVKGWHYHGTQLQMKTRYLLYAGHRDCEVQVSFDQPLQNQPFVAGVQNIKQSVSFADQKGLLACWGTDWPVNDTVKYAKETVGLAISLPEHLVEKPVTDPVNYMYILRAPGQTSFTYHISFTSAKESFGYKTAQQWFEHVQQWKKTLQQPLAVQLK